MFDKKSKHYRLRILFQFFDYAINNANLLYKHSCHGYKFSAKDLLGFLARVSAPAVRQVGPKRGVVRPLK